MSAAFSTLLTLFSSELVLHTVTLDRAVAYCVAISLSLQTQTVLLPRPFNAGEISGRNRIRKSLYLYLLTVIDASNGVLCPFYSVLSISAESPVYRKSI